MGPCYKTEDIYGRGLDLRQKNFGCLTILHSPGEAQKRLRWWGRRLLLAVTETGLGRESSSLWMLKFSPHTSDPRKKKIWKLAPHLYRTQLRTNDRAKSLPSQQPGPRDVIERDKHLKQKDITMTMEVAKQADDEYAIKPQAATPAIDTSSWPLLLKNYDKRESRMAPASLCCGKC